MPLIVSLFISTIFYPTLCLLSQSFLPPVFSFVFSVTQQHFRSPYAWLASLVATWLCTLRFFLFFSSSRLSALDEEVCTESRVFFGDFKYEV